MGQLQASFGASRVVRLFVLGASCLTLANCSSAYMAGKIDPRYGVAASARAVQPGEPIPKGGGIYRIGRPYQVAGRVYVPEEDINYSAVGLASWYGDEFHGRYTANGEVFDMNAISAAHPTLPLPSYVRVTNLNNARSIIVRVNDRGPYVAERLIDVSVKTAEVLGFYGHGVTRVKVEYVGRAPLEGSDDRKLMATLRQAGQAEAAVVLASSKPFASAKFDSRPTTNFSSARIPSPPDRPYRLGEGAREVAAVERPTTELPAAMRQRGATPVMREPVADVQPALIPVTTYVPGRYDGPTNIMSGRGLY